MKTENKRLCQREMSTKAVEEKLHRKPGKGNQCVQHLLCVSFLTLCLTQRKKWCHFLDNAKIGVFRSSQVTASTNSDSLVWL